MSSKAIVADNKIVFILFLKERSIESVKKSLLWAYTYI